jgi:DNA-binding CsgD family transcriptional regulator
MLAVSAGSNSYDVTSLSLGVLRRAFVRPRGPGRRAVARGGSGAPARLAAERSVALSTGWVFLIARALGVTAAPARNWPRAEIWFERAMEQGTAMQARPEIGRTALDHARMLIARGLRRDRSRAAELLERAGIFRELGMMPFLASARRLEAHLTAPPLGVGVSLSGRDEAVLTRIAHGCSDAEIARELLIPVATAKRTARRVLRKVGMMRNEVRLRAAPGVPLPASTATERPLCIIVFTDMQGSTELFQRLGDAEARAIMREHDATVRGCLQSQRQRAKHTGDGGHGVVCFRESTRSIARCRCSASSRNATLVRLSTPSPCASASMPASRSPRMGNCSGRVGQPDGRNLRAERGATRSWSPTSSGRAGKGRSLRRSRMGITARLVRALPLVRDSMVSGRIANRAARERDQGGHPDAWNARRHSEVPDHAPVRDLQ